MLHACMQHAQDTVIWRNLSRNWVKVLSCLINHWGCFMPSVTSIYPLILAISLFLHGLTRDYYFCTFHGNAACSMQNTGVVY